MSDMITNIIYAMIGALITAIFQAIPTKQITDNEILLKRFELYKKLYFGFVIDCDIDCWFKYSDFYTYYIKYLKEYEQDKYLLLDPISRKHMKNISLYYSRIEKEHKVINKLQVPLIKRNLRKLNKTVKKEFMSIQSKLGYPVRKGRYILVNLVLFLDILLITLIVSFQDLISLFPNKTIFYTIYIFIIILAFIFSFILYRSKGYLDIY